MFNGNQEIKNPRINNTISGKARKGASLGEGREEEGRKCSTASERGEGDRGFWEGQ
jgi:hypothetical protein